MKFSVRCPRFICFGTILGPKSESWPLPLVFFLKFYHVSRRLKEKDTDLKEIVAFVELENGSNSPNCSNNNSRIRENLKRILPAYMLPKKIFELEEIPRTYRGKIDREELKKILNSKCNYENNIK